MRNGIYSKLAWTNITKNRKIYFPYIVSAIGMVLMFYITLSLGMDDKVRQLAAGDATQIILRLGSIVIGIFSIILLFYTNSFLMKHRKTELGLYNVLGMGKTHIAKVLFWENLSTLLISILLGTLMVSRLVWSKAGLVRMFVTSQAQTALPFLPYAMP